MTKHRPTDKTRMSSREKAAASSADVRSEYSLWVVPHHVWMVVTQAAAASRPVRKLTKAEILELLEKSRADDDLNRPFRTPVSTESLQLTVS